MRAWKAGGALVAATFAVGATFAVSATGQIVNPDATIVVANLNPVQGETVEIHNADNDDSRCEGGTPVVFVGGLPPGILSQLVGEADENGDWSVDLYVPFQSDWPSNYVLGPYELEAFCFDEEEGTSNGAPRANADPEFAYVPVVVTVNVPVEPLPPVQEVAPVAVEILPTFTG